MINNSERVSIDYNRIEQAKLFQNKSKIKKIEDKSINDLLKSIDHIVVKLPKDVKQTLFGKNIFKGKIIAVDSSQDIPE